MTRTEPDILSPNHPHPAGALLLAAGRSERFNGHKLSQPFGDSTVIETTLAQLSAALNHIRIVVNATDSTTLSLLEKWRSHIVTVTPSAYALSYSIQTGIKATPHWQAWLICLADMPLISSSSYSQIMQHVNAENIVVPYYQQQQGNPVAFGQSFVAELMALTGDRGAKSVIQHNSSQVVALAVDDPYILCDIDTPQDLAKLSSSRDPSLVQQTKPDTQ